MRDQTYAEQNMAKELLELLALQGFVLDRPDAQNHIDRAKYLGQSALDLVEASLMLGRYSSGQLTPELTTVNFIEAVEDACHNALTQDSRKQIQMISRLGRDKRLAIADRKLLMTGLSQTLQAVTQLVDLSQNAIYLSSQGGNVYASVRTGQNLPFEARPGRDLSASSRRGIGQHRLDISRRLLELANFGMKQTRSPFAGSENRSQLSIVGQVSAQMGLF